MSSYSYEEIENRAIARFLYDHLCDDPFSIFDPRPIHIAALAGRKDMVELFLKRGTSVDIRDNRNGNTMLHTLAEKSKLGCAGTERYQELIRLLLNNTADINALNNKGCTPLLLAAQHSNKDIVELLIKLDANLKRCDENKYTVLHHAIEKGWTGIVRTLVQIHLHLDLNVKTSKGWTPLILAVKRSRADIVFLLIIYGADFVYKTCEGETLVHQACSKGWFKVVECLWRISPPEYFNEKDVSGNSPLLRAAISSKLDVVEFLIRNKADLKDCNQDGKSLLHYSCKSGWIEILIYLKNKGFDLNVKDQGGYTPLIYAAQWRNLNIVEYLIENKADVEAYGADGWTVLHYACRFDWADILDTLLQKKCPTNVQVSCDGSTALHGVAELWPPNLKFLKLLINAGADCSIVNHHGKTALNIFVRNFESNFKRMEGGYQAFLDIFILFLKNGAYLQTDDYVIIRDDSVLKEDILKNAQLCFEAVLNEFNYASLPKVYKIPSVSGILPSINEMKIARECQAAKNIAEGVKFEIQTEGYCNLLKAHRLFLSGLCVRSLFEY